MLDAHLKAAPESNYVGTEVLPLRRLDTVAAEYLRPDSRLFIKVDTQGFERQVLQGAAGLMKQATGLQLELSLVPLYENQSLYDELIATLKARGFELWDFTTDFVDATTGRVLQGNGTFFRA